jgi:hypothetical protein
MSVSPLLPQGQVHASPMIDVQRLDGNPGMPSAANSASRSSDL